MIEYPGVFLQAVAVYLIKLCVLGLALSVFAGCSKEPVAPGRPKLAPGQMELPTQAQPKLPTMKVYLGAETLDTELALTPEQEMTGMMFRTNILETDSMIFVLPGPQQASFWMKNCPESISAAFITPAGLIAEIHHFEKNDTTPVYSTNNNIQFVIETRDGWFDRHQVVPGMVVTTEHGSLAKTFLTK